MAFYKLDTTTQSLVCAPNAVHGPGYTLSKDNEESKLEMVDGWKWFDVDTEAYLFFGLTPGADPWTISPLQARIALEQAGLLATIETVIAGADKITQLAWANASEFKRTSPLLLQLAEVLGMTSQQLDDLFTAAKQIEV